MHLMVNVDHISFSESSLNSNKLNKEVCILECWRIETIQGHLNADTGTFITQDMVSVEFVQNLDKLDVKSFLNIIT